MAQAIAERFPTRKDLALWREFEGEFEQTQWLILRSRAWQAQADVARRVAQKHGVATPYSPVADQKLDEIMEWAARVKNLMRNVEDQRYGIRVTGDDFDIIKPSETGEVGGIIIPILIATGLVLLVGAIAEATKAKLELSEVEESYKKVVEYADDRFCSQPGSALCKDWTGVKIKTAYQRNEGLIDDITHSMQKVGKTISKGIGLGLMIGIPLVLWSMFGRKSQ